MPTYEFTFNVIGDGDDEESAWDEAQNRMPLLLSDAQDVTELSDEATVAAPPTLALTIADAAWEANEGCDDPRACLHTQLVINGLPMHLEAWEVWIDEDGVQEARSPYTDDFRSLHAAVSADGHFMTTTIAGREYILIATPHCT